MADPRTYFDYEADADKISNGFPIAFDYLEDEHVTVEVDGVQNTDIELTTGTPIKVKVLSGVTAGQIVRVRRISAPDEDLVDFVNGSVLTESELDRSYLHNRYLAEESAEQNDISLRVKAGADGQFDALNKKIINVSDPTADQDAATKNYVDDTVAGIVGGAIPDDSVTYAKLQNATGNNVLLGNDNGADSDVQELSATDVRTILNVADGAEVNVKSDWNEADTNSDAFIQNKPTIPTPTDPVPTGAVTAFAGSTAPTGYVLCDGAEYSETTEASLFAVLSTTYNTGGETANHFRVPDLRGRVVAGMGGSLLSGTDAVADTGGSNAHTLTIDQIPSHTHAGTVQSGLQADTGTGRLTNDAGNLTGATGGGLAHPNVQPTIILNYIIKT